MHLAGVLLPVMLTNSASLCLAPSCAGILKAHSFGTWCTTTEPDYLSECAYGRSPGAPLKMWNSADVAPVKLAARGELDDGGMRLASGGSLLPQQSSLAEDLTDEEFTPEELSLVQHLLPPERFIRVLLALRVTLKGCSESEDFATPVRQLQPNFDLNTCASQISTQSQKADQHIHTAQSPADGGTCRSRGNQPVPDSSNDDEVPVPARQFPTAAAEFWSRLQHNADTEADSEADSEANESCAQEEQGEQVLPHVQGSLQNTQSMSSEPAVELAVNRQRRLLNGKPLLHVSTRSCQLDHVQGSMLQHLTSSRLLAGGSPRSDCGIRVSHHGGMQYSSAAWLKSDSDADDDDDGVGEVDGDDSTGHLASQLQGESVRGFLARLRKPGTVSQQQQQQQKPLHQTQQANIPLQRQQQQGDVPQQHWQGAPARQIGLAAASALPHFAEGAARTSRHPASNAQVLPPSVHLNAVTQPLHLMTQGGDNRADGVDSSTMQSAVSAVVDRLQSVQMGLAGAEDRLALLSGVKLAGTRLPPADIQSRGSSPVLSPAAQGGGQLHALVQSSAPQEEPPQQDPAQALIAQDETPQQDPLQAFIAQEEPPQQDPSQALMAQEELPQQDPSQTLTVQDETSQQDPSQALMVQEELPQQDPSQALMAQEELPQQDPSQALMAQDATPQQDEEQCSAPQDGGQHHDSMQSTAAKDRGLQQDVVVQLSAAQHGEQQHMSKQSAAGSVARPHAVADIIRRFDSGSAWGSPQPWAHAKRPSSGSPEKHKTHANKPSRDSMDHAQQSPRISALMPNGERQEEHMCGLSHSDLTVTDRGNESLLLPSNSHCLSPSEGSSALLQPEGLLRHTAATKGTEVQPQLRGQGSSMRGDLWLPQLWLEPQEQMQGSQSPRNRMHKAMEAVREAERAVEAASVFAPTRLGIPLDAVLLMLSKTHGFASLFQG